MREIIICDGFDVKCLEVVWCALFEVNFAINLTAITFFEFLFLAFLFWSYPTQFSSVLGNSKFHVLVNIINTSWSVQGVLGTFPFLRIPSLDCRIFSFKLIRVWFSCMLSFFALLASNCVSFMNIILGYFFGSLDGVKSGQLCAGPTILIFTQKWTRFNLL